MQHILKKGEKEFGPICSVAELCELFSCSREGLNALLAANPGLKEARITRNKYSLALVTAALETPAPARSEELGTLAARLAQ